MSMSPKKDRRATTASGVAQDGKPIALMKPRRDGGKSVLAALRQRRTIRDISAEQLPPQVLSNLLWAAFGVNRKKGPFGGLGRTAASASSSQEIDIYVALPEGIYLYQAQAHCLTPVAIGDLRAKIGGYGQEDLVSKVPVSLIYVADIAKFELAPFMEPGLRNTEIQKSYYNVDTGLIAGNVYLFAASHGLAAWFHNCSKKSLAKELKLRPGQRVLYAHSVGYPAKSAGQSSHPFGDRRCVPWPARLSNRRLALHEHRTPLAARGAA